MPLLIPAAQLSAVKQQAYTTLDTLKQYWPFMEYPSKAFFLNAWAAAFEYTDWRDLQTTTAGHIDRDITPLITPETLPALAKRLREETSLEEFGVWEMKCCIFASARPDEIALFDRPEDYQLYSPEYDRPIRLEVGPMEATSRTLLKYIWPRHTISMDQIQNRFMDHLKDRRKGLTKDEIRAQGLNIYPKKEVKVDSVVENLIAGEYLNRGESDETLELTEHAYYWIHTSLTYDYGTEWQSWFKVFRKLMAEEDHDIEENWAPYISAFSSGISPEDAVNRFGWGSFAKECKSKLLSIAADMRLNHDEQLLHIDPTLYLAPYHIKTMARKIQLEIESNDIDVSEIAYKLNKPWPNKRYVGASAGHSLKGLFIKKPADVSRAVLTLRWTIPEWDSFPIEHVLTLVFGGERPSGDHFYSTAVCAHTGKHAPIKLMPYAFYDLYDFAGCQIGDGQDVKKLAEEHPRVGSQISLIECSKKGARIDKAFTVSVL